MFTGKCVLFYFIIIHVRMFLVCMSLHCVHVWCPQKPKVDMRYPVQELYIAVDFHVEPSPLSE